MKKILLILGMATCLFSSFAEEPDLDAILSQIDIMGTFNDNDFSSVLTMVSDDPEEGREVRKVNQFRRDKDDKFLMLILEPKTQRGQGYLMIDENLWLYDPESRKFTHTSMKESFEGTDARHSDFRNHTYKEDYKVVSWEEGRLGKYDVFILNLKGRHDEVTYPFQKIWVRKDNSLILKIEDYSLNNRHMRTSLFPGYAKVGDKYIPNKMLFIDQLVKGRKTQITMTKISLDKLPDSVFTKAYVERVNQ